MWIVRMLIRVKSVEPEFLGRILTTTPGEERSSHTTHWSRGQNEIFFHPWGTKRRAMAHIAEPGFLYTWPRNLITFNVKWFMNAHSHSCLLWISYIRIKWTEWYSSVQAPTDTWMKTDLKWNDVILNCVHHDLITLIVSMMKCSITSALECFASWWFKYKIQQ